MRSVFSLKNVVSAACLSGLVGIGLSNGERPAADTGNDEGRVRVATSVTGSGDRARVLIDVNLLREDGESVLIGSTETQCGALANPQIRVTVSDKLIEDFSRNRAEIPRTNVSTQDNPSNATRKQEVPFENEFSTELTNALHAALQACKPFITSQPEEDKFLDNGPLLASREP